MGNRLLAHCAAARGSRKRPRRLDGHHATSQQAAVSSSFSSISPQFALRLSSQAWNRLKKKLNTAMRVIIAVFRAVGIGLHPTRACISTVFHHRKEDALCGYGPSGERLDVTLP